LREPTERYHGDGDIGHRERPVDPGFLQHGVLGEDIGQRKLDHPLRDQCYHHGGQHVAGGPEHRDDAQLHADAAPGQAHDADEARALGDYLRIIGHEERDKERRERKRHHSCQGENRKAGKRAEDADPRRPQDVSGADVLPDQRRDRHRKAHRRNGHDQQDVGADAVGGQRQGAETRHQERHDHHAKPARRQFHRARQSQQERALEVK
jgi:hypothetical protein